MTTPSRQAESNANKALGDLLQGMMRGASVRSENTQVVEGHPGLRPDILITDSQRAPVVVEAEYMPAYTAEDEAKARLGLELTDSGKRIEAAIALRYPADIANMADIDGALRTAQLEYAVFYNDKKDEPRFPAAGWLQGGASDLADLIRFVSVSQSDLDAATDALEQGIERVAAIMDDMTDSAPAVIASVAQRLGMVNVPQTRRMACAILANSLIFQESIAKTRKGVKRPRHVAGNGVANPQSETLKAWADILKINYYPIFAIAMDILEQLDAHNAARILRTLEITAGEVNSKGVTNSHDLTGRIFQQLISDRKYLATFYTLPTSAALLARIAVSKLTDVDWADAAAIGELRVADFACGTGALLSAVYEQIATRHENAGGDPAALHNPMMEEVLYGCDVMPSAIHITGATLSSIRPEVDFNLSRLYTMPYGRQPDGEVEIGSLELLQKEQLELPINTNNPALRTGSMGEETAAYTFTEFPSDGFDIVIMNPPFTRNVTRRGETAGTIAAAFAAFGASNADQRAMANRMQVLKEGTCYHGNAGMATAFAALGDKKLKEGGVLALVLPLSASSGAAWHNFRKMLEQGYTDLTVMSIIAHGKDMAFSADTGMGECLVIARKRRTDEAKSNRAKFTSLRQRPQGFAQAAATAKVILEQTNIRKIESGPYGGELLSLGDENIGEMIDAPVASVSGNWGAVRLKDAAVAQAAHALSKSNLWLPAKPVGMNLKTALLSDVGKMGTYHLDIIGTPPRGPFNKIAPSPTATYPALWNHNAKLENRMVCEPDSQLQVRQGMESKAATIWADASRAHMSLDFSFTSQPLAATLTDQESMGGRAWPNVLFDDKRFEYPFILWSNSTLGLLLFWWNANKQHEGRGLTTIRSADSLPILDLRALTDVQLATAQEIFDQFRTLDLLPAYLADDDPNRALLDRRVLCDMLGFDADVYEGVRRLAAKWCAEPSVHGGKGERQPGMARMMV